MVGMERGVVPFYLMIWCVLEVKTHCWTVLTLGTLDSMTVITVRMLESDVTVRLSTIMYICMCNNKKTICIVGKIMYVILHTL